MFGIGMTELMVILVLALLILGPKRLPDLARSLGRGLAEFRRASTDIRREFLDVAEEVRIDAEDPPPGKARAKPAAAAPSPSPGRHDGAAEGTPAEPGSADGETDTSKSSDG